MDYVQVFLLLELKRRLLHNTRRQEDEDEDEEDDALPGQDSIESDSIIDGNGNHLNVEEEPESGCSIEPTYLAIQETLIL